MSNLEDQKDEMAALESIYVNSDATSKCVMTIIDATHLQFKFGVEGALHSFVLQIHWPVDYPSTSAPQLSLDVFYNQHLNADVKASIVDTLNDVAKTCEGMAATFSIVEYVNENLDTLLSSVQVAPMKCIKITDQESDTTETSERSANDIAAINDRKHMTKAQKRRNWQHGVGTTEERERGWNWVDLIRHLSQVGSAAELADNSGAVWD